MEPDAKPDAAEHTGTTATDRPQTGVSVKPKLLIAGGLSTLLVAVLGAAMFMFWPGTPDPASAKLATLAARQVAFAPAAASAASAAQRLDPSGQVAARDVHPSTRTAADAQLTMVKHRETSQAAEAGDAGSLAVPSAQARTPAGGDTAEQWGYAGRNGPQAWGRLKPEFAACASGQRQSPIDIRDGFRLDLEPLQFDYKASGFAVIDNGRTVQVNVAPGNSIEVLGRRYELQQLHFHRPSEERIDGRQFEMSAHLVHKDAQGHLAVVAVLLERGAAQPLLQAVWNNLPLEKGEEVPATELLEPTLLLPTQKRYYTYMGSLTAPPCSEGVLWVVMQQPVSMSAQQIDIFSRLYPMNARPIQRAAGRMIKQSN